MIMILGFYGSVNLLLGPNSSRLVKTNTLFVQSIKVFFPFPALSYWAAARAPVKQSHFGFWNRCSSWISQNLGQCYMNFTKVHPWMLKLLGLKHTTQLCLLIFRRQIFLFFLSLFPRFALQCYVNSWTQLHFWLTESYNICLIWCFTCIYFINYLQEWVYFLNEGSMVDIFYTIKSPSSSPLSLVIAQGDTFFSCFCEVDHPHSPPFFLCFNLDSRSCGFPVEFLCIM